MKNDNRKAGFSLVEIMIAAAAIGGLALVGMQLVKTQTKSSGKVIFDTESNQITTEIITILSDPDKCLATLGGKNALNTTAGINSIATDKYLSVASASAPSGGYGNGGVSISSYGLAATPAELSDNNSTLIINYQIKNLLKGESGPSTLAKKIKLYVEVDGANNITMCRSLSSSSANIWSRGEGSDIYYSGGNVGVGVTAPKAALDVAGDLKLASSNVGCSEDNEGSVRYNKTSKTMEYCNGTDWKGVGGDGDGMMVNMYQCPPSVGLGGGQWGYYGCQNQIASTPTCRVIEYPNSATFQCTYIGKMKITP